MSDVIVYAKCGRGDAQPIASFPSNHPMLNDMVSKVKADQIGKWTASGVDLSRCEITVKGGE